MLRLFGSMLVVLISQASANAFPGHLYYQGDQPVSQVQHQALSLLEGCLKMIESVEMGDFLLRETVTYDTLDVVKPNEAGEKSELKSLHRFSFDHKNHKYFYAIDRLEHKQFFPPDSSPPIPDQIKGRAKGIVVTPKERFGRPIPGGIYTISMSKSIDQVLSSELVPDHRVVGLKRLTSSPLFSNREKWLTSQIGLATSVTRIKQLDSGNVRLEFEFDLAGSDVGKQQTIIEIDPVQFVIMECSANALGVPVSGKSGESALMGRMRVEWQTIDDLPVPKRAIYRTPRAVWVGERFTGAMEEVVYEFHWFSVNKELDPRMFDKKVLENETELIRMTDPKATGAKSLLQSP